MEENELSKEKVRGGFLIKNFLLNGKLKLLWKFLKKRVEFKITGKQLENVLRNVQ